MTRCCAKRTGHNPKKMAGQQRTYQCRNTATRAITVFQASDHARVADGWFDVPLCDPCFWRSEANAIVVSKGRMPWRWL